MALKRIDELNLLITHWKNDLRRKSERDASISISDGTSQQH